MTDTYAKATLQGEIANKQGLTTTAGGLLTVNLKVSYEYNGKQIANYIPVRFFGDEAESIALTYKPGMVVKVQADIKMYKGRNDQWHTVALYGTAITKVDSLNDLLDSVDDFDDSGIPF